MHDGRTRKVDALATEDASPFLERHRASLTLMTGPEAGMEWALEGRRQIAGRSSKAAIRLEEGSVSAEHAAFELSADGFCVRDLASTNGVRVNGREVLSQRLDHGDRVTLGDCELHYVIEDRPRRTPVWSLDDEA